MNKKKPIMLYLIEIMKLPILELKNDITNAIIFMVTNMKTNFFKGKFCRNSFSFSLSSFLTKYRATNIDKTRIKISFRIRITLITGPSSLST